VVSWQEAGGAGLIVAALAGLALMPATPRLGRAAGWLWQAAIVIWLYGLWQLMLDHLVVSTAGALRSGRWVLDAERWLHLPSEHATQHPFLAHPWVLKAADRFYAWVDFPAVGVCLVYLFWFRRAYYWSARLTLILSTLMSSVLQAVPVAPPRLVPGDGVVDTGAAFHYLVYSPAGLSDPGQLTSMPSVHVVWAAFVAVAMIGARGSRWRWLLVAYPVLTIFVVVVTGNHYWLDAVVGLAFLGLSLGLQRAARDWTPVRRWRPLGLVRG
jgi:hypothetical protein